MKRGLNLLILSLVFGMFLVGGVSGQEIEYSTYPGTTFTSDISMARIWEDGVPSNVIDNDMNSYWGATGYTDAQQLFLYYMWYQMSFDTPVDLTRMELESFGSRYGSDLGNAERLEYFKDGIWNIVYSGDSIHPRQRNSVSGNWINVEAIRFYSYFGVLRWDSYGTYFVYDFKAYGPCTPETNAEFCSRLGVNCGVIVSDTDNCGTVRNNVDCGNCVSPNVCSSSNDIILKLSSESNAHGALWNDVNYPYDICYTDIFTNPYIGGTPHACSAGTPPDNKVLGLSDISNAHAQEPTLSTYPQNVCYSDLSCQYVAGNCPADYSCVVTLDNDDNAHLADCNSPQAYSNRICCLEGAELTGAYWADMANDLTEISQVDLNDRVQLRVGGVNMRNEEINYTIIKSIAFWFDKKIAETSTTGFTTWRAGNNEGNLESGTYYFEAEIADVPGIVTSGNLEVLDKGEENTPPLVEILKPNIGEIYYVGELIDFEGQISDVDDEFTFLWDFGDDTTGSELITTHSYAISGQKTITLTATDERGLVRSDMVSVLIISGDGEYAFAHIDEPEWGSSVGRVVNFNASSSYAIEAAGCSPGPCTLTCSAGGCPDNTLKDNSGQPIGTGACLLSPNGECRNFYNEIEFNWTFDDGRLKNGMGLFLLNNWVFQSGLEHTTLLAISKNPESSTTVEFFTFFDVPYCYMDEAGYTFWYEPSGGVFSSLDRCYKDPLENPLPSTDCCPLDYVCNRGNSICEPLEGVTGCSQYTNFGKGTCEANIFPAEYELNPILEMQDFRCGSAEEYGNNCWELVDCYCGFENNVCGAVAEHLICETNGNCYGFDNLPADIQTTCAASEPPTAGQCSFTLEYADECELSGFIIKAWNAVWSGAGTASECVSGEDKISCQSAKLAFWSVIGLILSILVIVIIYIVIVKKKKKK